MKNSNSKMILLFGSLAKQFNILLHAFCVCRLYYLSKFIFNSKNVAFINNLSELMLKSCVICYILLYVYLLSYLKFLKLNVIIVFIEEEIIEKLISAAKYFINELHFLIKSVISVYLHVLFMFFLRYTVLFICYLELI